MKKTIALLAALLLTLPLIAACGGGNTDTVTTTAAPSLTSGAPKETTEEQPRLEIRDYTGKEMNVWYSSGSTWSPYPLLVTEDDQNGDIVNNAGYKRNLYMEDTFHVTLNYTKSASDPNGSGATADLAILRNLNSSGDIANYDLVFTGATPAGQLAIEGFYYDIANSEYINAGADYYENQLNEQLKLFGHQFFASGYYSVMNTAAIDVTYVNTEIVEDAAKIQLSELYDLALSNKWTIEKLIEIGKNAATPDANTGDYNADKYSLILSRNYCKNIFYDLGGKIIEYNPTAGEYDVVLGGDVNMELFGWMEEHMGKSSGVQLVTNDNHTKAFLAKSAPFMIVTYYNVFKLMESDLEWAMLPTPLKEEGQAYRAYSASWNLNFAGIPAATSDPDKADYLYEMFMAASYEYVYPAYFELCFGTRYQPDSVGAQIFNLMASSRVICAADIYGMGGDPGNLVNAACSGSPYASIIKVNEKQIEAGLKKVTDAFGG